MLKRKNIYNFLPSEYFARTSIVEFIQYLHFKKLDLLPCPALNKIVLKFQKKVYTNKRLQMEYKSRK